MSWTLFMEEAKRQGLPFLLLMGGLYYLFTLNQKTEIKITAAHKEIQACQKELLEYYRADHQELTHAIQDNTQALRKSEQTRQQVIELLK